MRHLIDSAVRALDVAVGVSLALLGVLFFLVPLNGDPPEPIRGSLFILVGGVAALLGIKSDLKSRSHPPRSAITSAKFLGLLFVGLGAFALFERSKGHWRSVALAIALFLLGAGLIYLGFEGGKAERRAPSS